MKWFKHQSSAGESRNVNHLIDQFGLKGYAWWFLIVEMCSEKFDGQSAPRFTFHERMVRSKLRANRVSTHSFLTQCAELSLLSCKFTENEITIEMPKLLEIKDNHTRNLQATEQKVSSRLEKEEEEDKEQEKDKKEARPEKLLVFPPQAPDAADRSPGPCGALKEFQGDSDVEEILKGVLHATQHGWLKVYPDLSWTRTEIIKANLWLLANPKKRPRGKNMARFLGNWFSRGWETYRRQIPTNVAAKPHTTMSPQLTKEVRCESCDGFGNVFMSSADSLGTPFACEQCENGRKRIGVIQSVSWARKHGYLTRDEARELKQKQKLLAANEGVI